MMRRSTFQGRRDISGALAVGLLSVAVRLPGVWGRPFWEDEVASARILQTPTLGAMLHRVAHTESTPPFWYFVGWAVHRAGVPLQDVRLLSVLFGGMLAAIVVVLARRFVSLPLAVLAGLLTALGGEFVGHGHELRAYELVALLTAVLGLYALAELGEPSWRTHVGLSATVALGGLTHYFFAFSVIALLGWLWFDPGARRIRRRAITAVLVGCLVAAAWTPVLLVQYHRHRFWWIGSFRVRYVVAVPLRLFTYAYSHPPLGPVLSFTALVVVLIGCTRLARRSPEGRVISILAIVPLVEAAAVWLGGMQIFDLRNMIGVGAFVAVAAVVAVDCLPQRFAAVVAVALSVALASSLAVSRADRVAPYDRIARALVRAGWNGFAPIAVFGDPFLIKSPLEWYLPQQPVLDLSRPLNRVCAQIFIVERSGNVARQVRISVARDAQLRGATLLVEPQHHPRCVRLNRTGHIATVA